MVWRGGQDFNLSCVTSFIDNPWLVGKWSRVKEIKSLDNFISFGVFSVGWTQITRTVSRFEGTSGHGDRLTRHRFVRKQKLRRRESVLKRSGAKITPLQQVSLRRVWLQLGSPWRSWCRMRIPRPLILQTKQLYRKIVIWQKPLSFNL